VSTPFEPVLMYGYQLSTGTTIHLAEVDARGALDLPWLERAPHGGPAESIRGAFIGRLYGAIPATGDPSRTDWYVKREAVRIHHGVEIAENGWVPQWGPRSCALIAAAATAPGGYAQSVDLAELAARPAAAGLDGKLAAAVKILGITPNQDQPKWLLTYR
jgi:hypothetical protein